VRSASWERRRSPPGEKDLVSQQVPGCAGQQEQGQLANSKTTALDPSGLWDTGSGMSPAV
jgi:hypothetical protein